MNQHTAIDLFNFKQGMDRFLVKDPLTDMQKKTLQLLKTGISEKEACEVLGLGVYAIRSRAATLREKGWLR